MRLSPGPGDKREPSTCTRSWRDAADKYAVSLALVTGLGQGWGKVLREMGWGWELGQGVKGNGLGLGVGARC